MTALSVRAVHRRVASRARALSKRPARPNALLICLVYSRVNSLDECVYSILTQTLVRVVLSRRCDFCKASIGLACARGKLVFNRPQHETTTTAAAVTTTTLSHIHITHTQTRICDSPSIAFCILNPTHSTPNRHREEIVPPLLLLAMCVCVRLFISVFVHVHVYVCCEKRDELFTIPRRVCAQARNAGRRSPAQRRRQMRRETVYTV